MHLGYSICSDAHPQLTTPVWLPATLAISVTAKDQRQLVHLELLIGHHRPSGLGYRLPSWVPGEPDLIPVELKPVCLQQKVFGQNCSDAANYSPVLYTQPIQSPQMGNVTRYCHTTGKQSNTLTVLQLTGPHLDPVPQL